MSPKLPLSITIDRHLRISLPPPPSTYTAHQRLNSSVIPPGGAPPLPSSIPVSASALIAPARSKSNDLVVRGTHRRPRRPTLGNNSSYEKKHQWVVPQRAFYPSPSALSDHIAPFVLCDRSRRLPPPSWLSTSSPQASAAPKERLRALPQCARYPSSSTRLTLDARFDRNRLISAHPRHYARRPTSGNNRRHERTQARGAPTYLLPISVLSSPLATLVDHKQSTSCPPPPHLFSIPAPWKHPQPRRNTSGQCVSGASTHLRSPSWPSPPFNRE
ncbi:hypothetical protein D9619_008308 [Psilocybe cf. subviscida]|uniref:Uncharacterized protein n=1 Tax=Psilocybe cf. subviscida TaxID=2480587 RepID=A0A8H5F0M0_9AGAR|nr:hypothetical protein D9619_008308 [Psilocybe cf. subviscida]